MATYNGARFIDHQLASLERQRDVTVDLVVSDDGSSDDTVERVQAWGARRTNGRTTIQAGPQRGFSENFRSLSQSVDQDAGYYAFCDQDDVWDDDKLGTAIARLHDRSNPTGPAVYGSRTRLIDETGREIGYSPPFPHEPSFRNALVQSIAGGNTMVLNQSAFELFVKSAARTPFVSHDWWTYLILTGAGGQFIFDRQPHIGYRQHGGNLVGRNDGVVARARRFSRLLAGQFARWTSLNIAALEVNLDLLTPEAAASLAQLKAIRTAPRLAALRLLARSGLQRQTLAGTVALWLAVALNKV